MQTLALIGVALATWVVVAFVAGLVLGPLLGRAAAR